MDKHKSLNLLNVTPIVRGAQSWTLSVRMKVDIGLSPRASYHVFDGQKVKKK